MPKTARTKRARAARALVADGKTYSISGALGILSKLPQLKFKESIDVAVMLGIDPRKSDQIVRGVAELPSGSGRQSKIAVCADGEDATAAVAAGAAVAGTEQVLAAVAQGQLDFDVVIAHPDAMPKLAKVAPVLGPRGLMPNPKTGTITVNIEQAVRTAMAGQVRFRSDRYGIVHGSVGRLGFSPEQVKENVQSLCREIKRLKPPSVKGTYVRKIVMSSTMGPACTLDQSDLEY